jgi:hypothetical protein
MKTDSLKTIIEDQSFPAFVDQIQLKPSEFISGGNGIATTEEKNSPPISLKKNRLRYLNPTRGKMIFLNLKRRITSLSPF